MKTLFILFLATNTLAGLSQPHDSISKKIDILLSEYEIKKTPGIAVSVIKDGKVIYKRNKGYANLEHMIPITDSTRFLVGSISKQFTAFSILILEDEGKLSVDDDITEYLPELKELTYKITIRHLLNHTSGFRSNTDLNSLKGRTELDLTSQSEMVALLLRQKGLNFIPGSRFQYCNSGYVLLAEIVERISGISFSEFTQTRIFSPLQMKNSLFVDDPKLVVRNKANSYNMDNGYFKYIPLNRSVYGSTGLYTTMTDLMLWADNFNNVTVGNARIFTRMATKSHLNNGITIPYALGQELKTYKGLNVIFHGGGDAGFRSYLLRVPEQNFNIAISGNFESFNPLNISYGLLDIFLSSSIKDDEKKELPNYKGTDLINFEGDYQIFPGLFITIFAVQNSLYFRSYDSNDSLLLPILSDSTFIFPARAHSKIRFNKGGLKWHFSDFYYPGKKIVLNPPKYSDVNLEELIGIYKSDEIETSYELIIRDHKLVALHNFNSDEVLKPIGTDSFITSTAHISSIHFQRDNLGEIVGCKISGQSADNIYFSKME